MSKTTDRLKLPEGTFGLFHEPELAAIPPKKYHRGGRPKGSKNKYKSRRTNYGSPGAKQTTKSILPEAIVPIPSSPVSPMEYLRQTREDRRARIFEKNQDV